MGEGIYTAMFWEYDSRLGRRWNIDPVNIPSISSYASFNNNPIIFIDPLGLTPKKPPLIDRIKVAFGIGHFAGSKVKRNGKVVADNRVWRRDPEGGSPNSKSNSNSQNQPTLFDVDIIQPYEYIKQTKEEVTLDVTDGPEQDFESNSNLIGGVVYRVDYSVRVDEVRRNRGAGTMNNLLYDFGSAKFTFPSGGNNNTIIIIPRNDGGANMTITLTGDSRTAIYLKITNVEDLRRWSVSLNASVMSDYNTVTGILTYKIVETKLTTVTGLKSFEIVGHKKSRVNKPVYLKPIVKIVNE